MNRSWRNQGSWIEPLIWVCAGTFLLFFLSSVIISCNGTTYDEQPPTANLTYAHLRSSVFQPSCIGCHGPGPRDLTTYEALLKYVVPGKPEDSKLCQILRAQKMPPAKPLPDQIIEEVCQWIANGAPF